VTFLFTVEDAYQITGRGCVIVSSQPHSGVNFRLKARDQIQLRNPDGRVTETYIAAIEILCGPQVTNHMALMLPSDITKLDVPKGTEIWLMKDPN
jgi:hypothetical protein